MREFKLKKLYIYERQGGVKKEIESGTCKKERERGGGGG